MNSYFPGPRSYDPANGAGEPLSYLAVGDCNSKVVYAGGHVCICEYEYRNRIHVLDDNMSEIKEYCVDLPEIWYGAKSSDKDKRVLMDEHDFSLTAYDDMLIIAGPAAKDGSSDTFILRPGE